MEFSRVSVKMPTYGPAPARYGADAVKVSFADRLQLVRVGWRHVGTGTQYEYVVPPTGVSAREPVELLVPNADEIRGVALRMHQGREAQMACVEGFVAQYLPSGQIIAECVAARTYAPGRWGEVSCLPPPLRLRHATFELGIGFSAWSASAVWDRGDDFEPSWHRHP